MANTLGNSVNIGKPILCGKILLFSVPGTVNLYKKTVQDDIIILLYFAYQSYFMKTWQLQVALTTIKPGILGDC